MRVTLIIVGLLSAIIAALSAGVQMNVTAWEREAKGLPPLTVRRALLSAGLVLSYAASDGKNPQPSHERYEDARVGATFMAWFAGVGAVIVLVATLEDTGIL